MRIYRIHWKIFGCILVSSSESNSHIKNVGSASAFFKLLFSIVSTKNNRKISDLIRELFRKLYFTYFTKLDRILWIVYEKIKHSRGGGNKVLENFS